MRNYSFPDTCPDYLKQEYYDSIRRYLTKGTNPGRFMTAVLSNDMVGALGPADEQTIKDLKSITMFIYNDLPGMCHGSRAVVGDWMSGGYKEYNHDYPVRGTE